MAANKKHSRLKKTLTGESALPTSAVTCADAGACHSDPVGASFMTYQEQIKHPNWQKKRLETLEHYDYTCQMCGDTEKELHVHHLIYRDGHMIWEYPVDELAVLCKDCHKDWHETIKLFNLELGKTLLNTNGIWFDDLIGVLLSAQSMELSEFRKLVCQFNSYPL